MVQDRFRLFTTSITRAYKSINRIKNHETRDKGLKGIHVMCMYFLGQSQNGLTSAELARECSEDKAAISRTVAFLTDNGYVEPACKVGAKNYKAALVLTEAGKKVNSALEDCIKKAVDNASQGLSDEDREKFYRIFLSITDNLEKYCAQLEAKA